MLPRAHDSFLIRLARPDEDDACTALENAVWAPFQGGTDNGELFLGYRYPELHLVAVDQLDGTIVATAEACPFAWDGQAEHLPARGWQQATRAAAYGFASKPDYACALGITVSPDVRGHGLSGVLIDALLDAAKQAGYKGLAAPVRPTEKWRMPDLTVADYAQIRLPDGRLFDPWLRLHEQAGGQRLGVCEHSLDVEANRPDWERWTGLRLPSDGRLLIAGAVSYLELANDYGRLAEPSVWFLHE